MRDSTSLFSLLNSERSDEVLGAFGAQSSTIIEDFMTHTFGLEDFASLEQNMTHDFALVLNTTDINTPDIVMILHEEDT